MHRPERKMIFLTKDEFLDKFYRHKRFCVGKNHYQMLVCYQKILAS